MPLDKGLVAHVLEMLEPLGGITGRAMFGGYGVWHEGQMFALFNSDTTFYLKVDASNRAAFQAAGSAPFTPNGSQTSARGFNFDGNGGLWVNSRGGLYRADGSMRFGNTSGAVPG